MTIYILLVVSSEIYMKSLRCGAHNITSKITQIDLNENEFEITTKTRYLQSIWEPIRIKADYTQLDTQIDISSDKRTKLKQVIDETISL